MASTRANPRRGAPPMTLSPHPKPVISMEEWEARAPLGDKENKSINAIKTAGEKAPLPLKFITEEPGSSRPQTPTLRNKLTPGSRPGTPSLLRPNLHSLHPKEPVQTPQQFYDWFALIDRSVAHSQEAHFRAHVANVSEHLDTCDKLVETIDDVNSEVEGMLQGWRGVEESGKSLKEACEKLLEERDHLLAITDEIGTRLDYFQELEKAARMLNHPGESLVLQTDFLYMVERVDICIEYLRAHRHFREAEIYLLRYQQCMTRAMTLIKMYFVGSLRALTSDVSKRLYEKDVSSTAQMHLLYTRFQTVSSQLAPLLGELERRARAHPEDLSALLTECHASYFSARRSLLVGRLAEEIKGLDPTRTELVELTRAGCSYLKQVCTDEFDLYRSFFSTGEEQLYVYLENLCDYLYDDLRPRILHEPRLTSLCEVCTVLQALMVLDVTVSPSSTSDSEDDNELTTDLDMSHKKGLGRLQISHLLQMVLQDAQTRLFFKAQSVIQSDIRYYVPKAEDLAYPDILVSARKPVSGYEIKEKESISQFFQISSLDKQDTWFPTLRKTLWVLSQLHDFVKPAIFEDIAQEAVSLCRQSLVSASEMIKARNPPSSVLDGQLFLVRHLLILKEMAHNLDLAQKDVGPSIDYTGVTDTLSTMLNRTTSLLPNALFASLGMPRSDENIAVAKHGIDHELKRACEAIIASCAEHICHPLDAWVERVRAYPSQPAQPLTAQPWAQLPAATALDDEFRSTCARDLRAAVARLRLYLEDVRTVNVLVGHVRERVEDAYGAWRDIAWNMHAGSMREVVMNQSVLRTMLEDICGDGPVAGSS